MAVLGREDVSSPQYDSHANLTRQVAKTLRLLDHVTSPVTWPADDWNATLRDLGMEDTEATSRMWEEQFNQLSEQYTEPM